VVFISFLTKGSEYMVIAFYIGKSNGWYGALIRFITRSEISHCAIVFSDNKTVFSALAKGVSYESIEDDIAPNSKDWFFLDIPWITEEDEEKIKVFCNGEEGSEYDYLGVILGWRNPMYQHRSKWFCSELCRDALLPFTKGLKERWCSPAELYRALKHAYIWNT